MLAAILAGRRPASQTYVAMKERACARAGIGSRTYPFGNDASEAEVADCLAMLNADPSGPWHSGPAPAARSTLTSRPCCL